MSQLSLTFVLDQLLSYQDANEIVAAINLLGTVRTVDPAAPANGDWWLFDDGGTPATVSLRYRKGGFTKEIVLGVLS